jgi:hypothetical protein
MLDLEEAPPDTPPSSNSGTNTPQQLHQHLSDHLKWSSIPLLFHRRSTFASIIVGRQQNPQMIINGSAAAAAPGSVSAAASIAASLGTKLGNYDAGSRSDTTAGTAGANAPNAAGVGTESEDLPTGSVIIVGGPAQGREEEMGKFRLRVVFTILDFLNVIVSSVLFLFFQNWSLGTIQNPLLVIEGQFSVSVQFTTSLLIAIFGVFAIWMKNNTTLLTLYMVMLPAHFFLFIAHVPYFIYAVRYIFDFFLFVLADNLRTRLTDSWFALSSAE